MAIPIPPNRTFEVFHQGTVFPGMPDISGAVGYLEPAFRAGQEASSGDGPAWTHILLVDLSLDVRDGYHGEGTFQLNNADSIYMPDQTGTGFRVIFIERVQEGTANEHKRVYLDRVNPPTWPTNYL